MPRHIPSSKNFMIWIYTGIQYSNDNMWLSCWIGKTWKVLTIKTSFLIICNVFNITTK